MCEQIGETIQTDIAKDIDAYMLKSTDTLQKTINDKLEALQSDIEPRHKARLSSHIGYWSLKEKFDKPCKTERKRLLRKYHPDNLDTGDIKKFQEVNR
jgi:hypothetical protein